MLETDIQIRFGSWPRMQPLAAPIRLAVFVHEQGISESEEWDEADAVAVHWVALFEGEPVGCARLLTDGKIGRMAVLKPYRGMGAGKRLLQCAVEYAAERRFAKVALSAQMHAKSFYEQQGFIAEGEPHFEVGIEHQWMSLSLQQAPKAVPLLAFLEGVSEKVSELDMRWVIATVSELKRPGNGHVYFTLVESDAAGSVVGKVRANLWKSTAMALETKFRAATSKGLENNQEVMLQVKAEFHPGYGMSVVVKDIHPEFTLGQLQARLQAIRLELQRLGIATRNKALPVPEDFFRIAVLSPEGAAGLGDFQTRADGLMHAGVLQFVYFTAVFQGTGAASAMSRALDAIARSHAERSFDALVIIRGGGSELDLAWLNDIEIARRVCLMPMPVLAGIGHERDNTIVDELACLRFPTPSMVIDYIEEVVLGRLNRVARNVRDVVRIARQKLETARLQVQNTQGKITEQARLKLLKASTQADKGWQFIRHTSQSNCGQGRSSVERLFLDVIKPLSRQQLKTAAERLQRMFQTDIKETARRRLETASFKVESQKDVVAAQNPERILQLGYALVLDANGQALTSAGKVRQQTAAFNIQFKDGTVGATLKEEPHNE
ncbi:MAG: exodeoxyribonuclease VII large subunit [Burkholderiales bacterium]|nr:exodeoxyribonuclease VII large subunit [Burkholderiales bacterium]